MSVPTEGAAAPSAARKALMLVLRIAVSAGLLYLAMRHVDWPLLLGKLRDIDPVWFAFAVLCLAAQWMMAAVRWRRILQVSGVALPYLTALRYCFIAAFFNQTLPASVGGDAVRIWLVSRDHANWKAPLYSIVIDRSIGGIALALLVLLCLPLGFALIPQPAARLGLILVGIGCLAVFTAVLVAGALPFAWIDQWKATRQSRAVTRIAKDLFSTPGGAAIMALSLVIHLDSAVAIWSIAQAISVALPLSAALVLVPPIILIAMVPISIAGWGVRESAVVALLAYAGVGNSDGVLISVLFGAASFLVGMIGGVLWLGASHSRLRA